MLAGSPLSYWAGVHGKNPMRYLGGLLGGTWLTSLAGDLGNGIFDGANLVANFESLQSRQHVLDQGSTTSIRRSTPRRDRFLEFETWWGSPVLLNAEEMQSIADNLFVGNRLSTGRAAHAPTGCASICATSNRRSSCSAHGATTSRHRSRRWTGFSISTTTSARSSRTARRSSITLHQSIGHLGIFVSGKVATKEHGEFVSCMDMIDVMPPGLYEAVITEVDENTVNPELVQGNYLFSLEARTLDDIRALGGNDAEDDLALRHGRARFGDQPGLYEHSVAAGGARGGHGTERRGDAAQCIRTGCASTCSPTQNPLMQPVQALAESVRAARQPGEPRTIRSWRWSGRCPRGSRPACKSMANARDTMTEAFFLNTYGSPLAAGDGRSARRRPQVHRASIERDLAREASASANAAGHWSSSSTSGGLDEAVVRALIYVRLPEGNVDERGFAALKQISAVASGRQANRAWPGSRRS